MFNGCEWCIIWVDIIFYILTMYFPTVEFLSFFTFVLFFNWILKRFPLLWKVFLLLVSYWFYSFLGAEFIWLLTVTILINYLGGLLISFRLWHQGILLSLFVIINLCILGFFKYYDFFRTGSEALLSFIGLPFTLLVVDIAMPLGISFYIFRSISYLVDVYSKKIEACRSLLDFSIYISFFPQIFSGPIERAGDFLPQLKNGGVKKVEGVEKYLTLILLGFFKKLVIVGYLMIFTDPVFAVPENQSSFAVWLSFFAYPLVIYFDFSGYTDMAIGLAGLLGFKSAINFDYPYLAKNIKEFWRKWHISLSKWVRDYIYIPLGGSRKGLLRKYFLLLFIMMVIGIWHDATENYLVWGLINGLGLALFAMLSDALKWILKGRDFPRIPVLSWLSDIFSIVITYLFVSISWVFFKASNINNALEFFYAMMYSDKPLEPFLLYILLIVLCGYLLFLFERQIIKCFELLFKRIYWPLLPILYTILVLMVFKLGQDTVPSFIYFNF